MRSTRERGQHQSTAGSRGGGPPGGGVLRERREFPRCLGPVAANGKRQNRLHGNGHERRFDPCQRIAGARVAKRSSGSEKRFHAWDWPRYQARADRGLGGEKRDHRTPIAESSQSQLSGSRGVGGITVREQTDIAELG